MHPEIARRAILAGTSEKGVCPECGGPWRRVVERGEAITAGHGTSHKRADTPGASTSASSVFRTNTKASLATVGWTPTCKCGRTDTVPAMVLDPFDYGTYRGDKQVKDYRILQGDVRDVLATLPDESVHCVVTSPPYWGLRDYGTGDWDGGDPSCGHRVDDKARDTRPMGGLQANKKTPELSAGTVATIQHVYKDICGKCGARRVDRQLGLEPTPGEFVQHMVEIFREVRRVLRRDGTLWLNLGDSYIGYKGANYGLNPHASNLQKRSKIPRGHMIGSPQISGMKSKDLVGMPWRVAQALQEPYHTGPIKRPEDRAWLAGLIDADGSLGIRVQHPREGRGTNETFVPYLTVSQSDTAALEHCVEVTGLGRINIKARPSEDNRGIRTNRTFYTWRLDGQQASRVIRDIYPYLLIKRVQAQVVYAMNESLKWGRPTRSLPVPGDVMAYRRRLYAGIKLLNQRAPVDLPHLPEVPPAMEPGWYLRSAITWCKRAPMPESVTDRPTSATEMIFLLTKAEHYFYDSDAVRQPAEYGRRDWSHTNGNMRRAHNLANMESKVGLPSATVSGGDPSAGRNLWNYWLLGPEPYAQAHFATFPTAIPERCIRAGTSERGVCPECGAPWRRVTSTTRNMPSTAQYRKDARPDHPHASGHLMRPPSGMERETVTIGWEASCKCGRTDTVPATVLDPFSGAGTTALVALRLGRRAVGIELNPEYIGMSHKRILGDPQAMNLNMELVEMEESA